MVLRKDKVPKDIYDWLIDEAVEFHSNNEEVMKRIKEE